MLGEFDTTPRKSKTPCAKATVTLGFDDEKKWDFENDWPLELNNLVSEHCYAKVRWRDFSQAHSRGG
jgi:hypothetical protein